MITFPSSIRVPISNYLTGEDYFMVRGDHFPHTDERLSEIVRICNEPEIYKWLFSRNLGDQRYTVAKALEWLKWATEGWHANTHFCFVTLDLKGSIVAACDIKSADEHGAEIGYWATSSHPGIMTNTVVAVIREATKAGFHSLMARARHDNIRSKGVMKRAGFLPDPARKDDSRDYFILSLDSQKPPAKTA